MWAGNKLVLWKFAGARKDKRCCSKQRRCRWKKGWCWGHLTGAAERITGVDGKLLERGSGDTLLFRNHLKWHWCAEILLVRGKRAGAARNWNTGVDGKITGVDDKLLERGNCAGVRIRRLVFHQKIYNVILARGNCTGARKNSWCCWKLKHWCAERK